jgi:hypothetical protein
MSEERGRSKERINDPGGGGPGQRGGPGLSKKKRAASSGSEDSTSTIGAKVPSPPPRNRKGQYMSRSRSSAASRSRSSARVAGVAGADGRHRALKDAKIAHTAGYDAVADGGTIPNNFKLTLEVPAPTSVPTPSRESARVDCGPVAGDLPEDPIDLAESRAASVAPSQASSDLYIDGIPDLNTEEAMLIDGATNTAYRRAEGGLLPPAAQPLGAEPSGPPAATREDNADASCAGGAHASAPASATEVAEFAADAGPEGLLQLTVYAALWEAAGTRLTADDSEEDEAVSRRVAPGGVPVSDALLGEEIAHCCRTIMGRVRRTIQLLDGLPNPVAREAANEIRSDADGMLSHSALLSIDRLGSSAFEDIRSERDAAKKAAHAAEERVMELEAELLIAKAAGATKESLVDQALQAERMFASAEARIAEMERLHVALNANVKVARAAERQALEEVARMQTVLKAQAAEKTPKSAKKKTVAEMPEKSAETASRPSATPASGLAASMHAPNQVPKPQDHVEWAPGRTKDPRHLLRMWTKEEVKGFPPYLPDVTEWAEKTFRLPGEPEMTPNEIHNLNVAASCGVRIKDNRDGLNFLFKNFTVAIGGVGEVLDQQEAMRAEMDELKRTMAQLTRGGQVLPKKTRKPAAPAAPTPTVPAPAEFALAPELSAPAPPTILQPPQGVQQDWMESEETGPAVERHSDGKGGFYTVVPYYDPYEDPVFGRGPEGAYDDVCEPHEDDAHIWGGEDYEMPPVSEEAMAGGWDGPTDQATAPAPVAPAKKSAKAAGKEKEKPAAQPEAKPAKAKPVTEAKAATGTGAGAPATAKKPSATRAAFAGTAAMVAATASAADSWATVAKGGRTAKSAQAAPQSKPGAPMRPVVPNAKGSQGQTAKAGLPSATEKAVIVFCGGDARFKATEFPSAKIWAILNAFFAKVPAVSDISPVGVSYTLKGHVKVVLPPGMTLDRFEGARSVILDALSLPKETRVIPQNGITRICIRGAPPFFYPADGPPRPCTNREFFQSLLHDNPGVFGANGGAKFYGEPWPLTGQQRRIAGNSVTICALIADPEGTVSKRLYALPGVWCLGSFCKVEPWDEKPVLWQCTKCCGLGHTDHDKKGRGCKAKARCHTCSSTEHKTHEHAQKCMYCKHAPTPGPCPHQHCFVCDSNAHGPLNSKCGGKKAYKRPNKGTDFLGRPAAPGAGQTPARNSGPGPGPGSTPPAAPGPASATAAAQAKPAAPPAPPTPIVTPPSQASSSGSTQPVTNA